MNMNQRPSIFIGAALALALRSVAAQNTVPVPTPLPYNPALNPPPGLAVATVLYPSGGSVVSHCQTGRFELVTAQPGDVLQVTIYYPTNQALQTVDLEALDGGGVFPPTLPLDQVYAMISGGVPLPVVQSLVIDANGTISFTFAVGQEPGLRQISLRQADQELGLQFWVNDPDNPDSNPPALAPQP
jgi:hypothetical protein